MNKYYIDKHDLADGLSIHRRTPGGSFYARIRAVPKDRKRGERIKYKNPSLRTTDLDEAKRRAFAEQGKIEFRLEQSIPITTKNFQKAYEEWIATGLNTKSASVQDTHRRNGVNYFFEYFNQRELGLIDEVFVEDYFQWRLTINKQRAKAGIPTMVFIRALAPPLRRPRP